MVRMSRSKRRSRQRTKRHPKHAVKRTFVLNPTRAQMKKSLDALMRQAKRSAGKKRVSAARQYKGASKILAKRRTSGALQGPFCGPAGGAGPFAFPVTTHKQARAALAYSRFAPYPTGIVDCVDYVVTHDFKIPKGKAITLPKGKRHSTLHKSRKTTQKSKHSKARKPVKRSVRKSKRTGAKRSKRRVAHRSRKSRK